jgi:hypothetical protein
MEQPDAHSILPQSRRAVNPSMISARSVNIRRLEAMAACTACELFNGIDIRGCGHLDDFATTRLAQILVVVVSSSPPLVAVEEEPLL